MQIAVIVEKSAFDRAVAAADAVGRRDSAAKGLEAPVDGALSGWIDETWDSIRGALERAYLLGRDAAQAWIDKAQAKIDLVMTEAGKRAGEVVVALRAKLARYVSTLIDEMLAQVRPSLRFGDGTLKLAEVQVSQKLVLGGSLKASLDEAIALTSGNEFSIEASYR